MKKNKLFGLLLISVLANSTVLAYNLKFGKNETDTKFYCTATNVPATAQVTIQTNHVDVKGFNEGGSLIVHKGLLSGMPIADLNTQYYFQIDKKEAVNPFHDQNASVDVNLINNDNQGSLECQTGQGSRTILFGIDGGKG